MYNKKPWTLEEERDNRTSTHLSNYVEKRKIDMAISTARVQKLFEVHKEKTFTTAQVAIALGLSEGTVSSILNRLVTLEDINVVFMQRPHWSPVYQYAGSSSNKVFFTYKKEDPILKVIKIFKENKDTIYSKKDILKIITCSNGMLTRILQILLLKGDIKMVGSKDCNALYQYKLGNAQGILVSNTFDDKYIRFIDYINEKNLKDIQEDIKKHLSKAQIRLFYSSTGLKTEFLKEDLDKIVKNISKIKFFKII